MAFRLGWRLGGLAYDYWPTSPPVAPSSGWDPGSHWTLHRTCLSGGTHWSIHGGGTCQTYQARAANALTTNVSSSVTEIAIIKHPTTGNVSLWNDCAIYRRIAPGTAPPPQFETDPGRPARWQPLPRAPKKAPPPVLDPDTSPEQEPLAPPAGVPHPMPYPLAPYRRPNPFRPPNYRPEQGYETPGSVRRPSDLPTLEYKPHGRTKVVNRPHRREPPKNREKEKKVKSAMLTLALQVFHGLTEFDDFIDAFHDALPKHLRTKWKDGRPINPFDKAKTVFDNLDNVDWNAAARNYVKNAVEDGVIGRLEGLNKTRRPDGTEWTGVSQPYGNEVVGAGELAGPLSDFLGLLFGG